MSAPRVVARGVVLVRSGGRVSAVLSRPRALDLQRRYGGRIVSAVGRRFRVVQGLRVLVDRAGL